MKGFIEGTSTNIMPWQIDVRDIGRAHVRAAEVRHACSSLPLAHAAVLQPRSYCVVIIHLQPVLLHSLLI